MADLQNPRVIYLKGGLFLLCGIISVAILLAESWHWQTALLLSIAIWSFCRFYYFAFYVVEHYVDGKYRFAGLWDFARYWARKRSERHGDGNKPNSPTDS